MALELFSEFVDLCEKLVATPGKNKKVELMAGYLSRLDDRSLEAAVLFLSGSVFPKDAGVSLNVGYSLIMKSRK